MRHVCVLRCVCLGVCVCVCVCAWVCVCLGVCVWVGRMCASWSVAQDRGESASLCGCVLFGSGSVSFDIGVVVT